MATHNLIVLVALAASLNTTAEEVKLYTGSELLGDCTAYVQMIDSDGKTRTSSPKIAGKGMGCFGFVFGFGEGVGYAGGRFEACFPSDVTRNQYIRVIVKYLEDHPEQLHLDSSVLIDKAFTSAFPCEGGAE